MKGGNKADILDGKALRRTLCVYKSELIAQARSEEMQLKTELQQARTEYIMIERDHAELRRKWNMLKRELSIKTEKRRIY